VRLTTASARDKPRSRKPRCTNRCAQRRTNRPGRNSTNTEFLNRTFSGGHRPRSSMALAGHQSAKTNRSAADSSGKSEGPPPPPSSRSRVERNVQRSDDHHTAQGWPEVHAGSTLTRELWIPPVTRRSRKAGASHVRSASAGGPCEAPCTVVLFNKKT
jgi:hypothetical protein